MPRLGIEIAPVCGTLLLFENLDANGTRLPDSVHQSTPVRDASAHGADDGSDGILQKWGALRRLPLAADARSEASARSMD